MRKIIIYKNQPYSTFKKFCELHGLKYNTWNKKDFPILFDGGLIYKEALIK
jgi:hypothetical protein